MFHSTPGSPPARDGGGRSEKKRDFLACEFQAWQYADGSTWRLHKEMRGRLRLRESQSPANISAQEKLPRHHRPA